MKNNIKYHFFSSVNYTSMYSCYRKKHHPMLFYDLILVYNCERYRSKCNCVGFQNMNTIFEKSNHLNIKNCTNINISSSNTHFLTPYLSSLALDIAEKSIICILF